MADDWTPPVQRIANDVVTATNWNEQIPDNMTALKNALSGDAQATAEVIHQHKSGTWANRGAAANAGRFYYCTDTGWTLQDDGTLWHIVSHNPKLSDHLYEDFHAPGSADLAAAGYIFGWHFAEQNPGGLLQVSGGNFENSMARLVAYDAVGSVAHFSPVVNNNGYIDPAVSYPLVCEMGVRLKENASVTYHFGLFDGMEITAAAQPNSSIMFGYGRSGDADALQYFAVTQDNGGGETTTDSATTPTHTAIDICRIEVDSTSAARFYVNGSLVATHAAGIPAGTDQLHPGFSVRSNVADGDKTLRVDYIDLYYKRNLGAGP
jgi:hypothetical protein